MISKTTLCFNITDNFNLSNLYIIHIEQEDSMSASLICKYHYTAEVRLFTSEQSKIFGTLQLMPAIVFYYWNIIPSSLAPLFHLLDF